MSGDPRKRRRRLVLLCALLCVGGTVWFLRTQYAWDKACELARTRLPEALNADVQIGACEIDPLTQSVIAKDIEVRPREAAPDAPPLLSAERAEVALAGVHPFFRTVELNRVEAQKPKVVVDLRNPKPKTGEAGKCSLDPARRVEIDKLALKDAQVTLLLPDDRRVEISRLDVRWTLRRGVAEFEIEAKDGLLHLGGAAQDLALTRLLLQGNFSADDEEIEFTRAEVGLDDVTVNWTGRVEDLCDPNLSLEAQLFLPLRSVAKVVSLPQPTAGHVWSKLSLSGKIAEPIASLEVAGSDVKIDKFVPGDFRAQLSYAGRNVTVNSLVVPVGSGSVKASGAVQLIPGFPLQAKADLEGVSLARVLERVGLTGAWVDFLAAGRGQITGKLHPLELAGEADLKAQKFLLATRPYDAPPKSGKDLLAFPAAHVTTNLRVLPDRVELSALEASTPHTTVHADVTLHYEQAKGLLIKGNSEQLDLSEFGQLAGIRWAGKGSASFDVEGPYSDVKVGALVNMRDFDFWDFSLGVVQGRLEYANKVLSFPGISGQKGRTPFSGSGALAFGDKKTGMHAVGHVSVAKGRIEDVVDLIAPMNDSISLFQGTLQGEVTGAKVDIDCPVEKLAGSISLDVAKTTYYDRPVGDGHLQLTLFDGVGMRLEPATLQGELGTTHADGTFLFDGPLDYRFKLENYSLAEIIGPETAKKGGIDGTLTMVGKVEGDSTTPVVTAYLTSPKIEVGEKNVGAMHLEGRIQGKDLQVWGKPFDDARLFSKMRLKDPFPYQGQVTLSLPEIKPLLPATAVAQGLSGALSGTFTARGSINEEDSLDASAQIDKLTLNRGDFSGSNDGPIVLTFNHGKLDVQALSFKGPNTELSAAGWAGPQNMDIKLRGTFDMRLVESFTSYFERTGGKIELNAAATGPMKTPSIVGSAMVQDARLSMRDQAIAVRGVNGRIDFSEQRVLVQDLTGVVNNGRVTVHGDLRLDKFKLKDAQVGVELDEVKFQPREYLPITASGELLMYGKPESLTLTGGVHLVKLRYDQQLDLQSVLADARKGPSIGGTSLEKPKEWLHLNVDIFADGDVRVDNNLARAKLTTGSGKLTLTGTNVHPGLVGTIETAEGSEAFYRNNRFQISQGLLEFKDRKNIDPVFDLRAETQVREYLVKLRAFGRPASPQIILSSEPELSEADILSLLTLGVISKYRGTGTAGAGAGLAAEAFFTASGLGQQVQRFLPKNQVFRDMSFNLSTTYNDATGLVEPTAQLESKFLTERLKLNMRQPVSGRGTHAGAEYRFDDSLSGQVQWDNEVSDYSFGNLGLELKLRWEVKE